MGTGVQENDEGLTVKCLICHGSGVMSIPTSPRDSGITWTA